MRWLLIILAALVVLVIALVVIGSTRPNHVATITFSIAKPDSVVWAVVSDFPKVPEWFSEVNSVQRVADVEGKPAYRERYGRFAVTNVVSEWVERRRIVREIMPEGSFSGTWTIELEPEGGGTKITITERGHVESVLFRTMMMFADPRKTMRKYAAALGKRLGAPVAD